MTNDNDYSIDAQTNVQNLDIVGRILLNASKGGKHLDSMTALLCSSLIAECRVYSTRRDSEFVSDDNSQIIKDEIARFKQEEQNSVSSAADEIVEDLRKSGINI
jgi:hypothetical protein